MKSTQHNPGHQNYTVRRISPRSASKASRPRGTKNRRPATRLRGQAMLLVALSSMLLLLVVALAVDGGSMLNQRRQAQNGVDGASLAGARAMLPYYEEMISNNDTDIDYAGNPYELNIRRAIDSYAASNGVLTSTLHAYFINDQKGTVSVHVGVHRGGRPCGVDVGDPCEVGENGRVPWTLGAKGVMVKGTSQTQTFFMGMFGWDKAAATATATGFMGVGVLADEIALVPIGLFTTTLDLNHMHEGDHYVLIDSTFDTGSGNWGWVNYTPSGASASVAKAWIFCGYNPSVSDTKWPTWCPDYKNVNGGWAPTQHYVSMHDPNNPNTFDPDPNVTLPMAIVYGDKWDGWWLQGSSGAVNSNCQDFMDKVVNGAYVYFPIIDVKIAATGSGTRYHMRAIVKFWITKNDVSCKPFVPPAPTPCNGLGTPGPTCPPLPTPVPGGNKTKWHIEGTYYQMHSTSSGRIGDLRKNPVHTVFLDN